MIVENPSILATAFQPKRDYLQTDQARFFPSPIARELDDCKKVRCRRNSQIKISVGKAIDCYMALQT